MSDDDYKYLRSKVDSIFKRTEQIPVIMLRLDSLNNFKAKCEEDRNEFEDRVSTLETEVVSDGKIEEFKQETRKNRRWLIGIFITVVIFIGTMAYSIITTRPVKAEESQVYSKSFQYCNCNIMNRCFCNNELCNCVVCRTAIIEEDN